MPANPKRDVLVTGASGAIGQAIVRRLANAGYRLHVTSRQPAKLATLQTELEQTGVFGGAYRADLSELPNVDEVIRQFFENAPAPFGLVCNAGNAGPVGPFLNVDFQKWRHSLQENFVAYAAMIRAFAVNFQRRKATEGAIIVLSGAGLGGNADFTDLTSYSTPKAALTHLSEALAGELRPLGIRINAISPGQVVSGLTDAIGAGLNADGAKASGKLRYTTTNAVSPELAAELVELLFAPAARQITGRLLSARFDRDRIRNDAAAIEGSPSLFRLRRIDEELFNAGKK